MKLPVAKILQFSLLVIISLCRYFTEAALITAPNGYIWKSGSWSSCMTVGNCGFGKRIREVICHDPSGFLVVENSNCNESKKPSSTEDCFKVCEKHKEFLRWRIGKWSPCIPKTSHSSSVPCTGVSLPGVAERKISCIFTTTQNEVDISACERFWDAPESKMSCSLDCPQDCVVTNKNVTCILDGCEKQHGWTREVTEMVVSPSGEGASCPEVSSEAICRREMLSKICRNSEIFKKRFLLKIGDWSECRASDSDYANEFHLGQDIQLSLQPVIGVARRNITCITEEGIATDLSLCNAQELPVSTKRCVVPIHCEVSPWSEWRVRKEGCISSDGRVHPETRTRNRRLLQMPVGVGARPCPPLYEERNVSNDLPSCYKYQWFPLEWSDCEIRIHGQHLKVHIVKPSCGSGLQYRNVTCLRASNMIPVNDTYCKEAIPATIQRCKVPCNRDCQVSHWSRWSPCSITKKNKEKPPDEIKGTKTRERSIIASPLNGGISCPHLHEVDLCIKEDILEWHYGEWKECVINNPQETCGDGTRSRDKTCFKLGGVNSMKLLDNFNCDKEIMTYDEEDCRIYCPNDCVLSEWSEWSTCSSPCYTRGRDGWRKRNRTLIAVAGKGGECDEHMMEVEPCNERHCYPFKWQVEDWGPCLQSVDVESNSVCGVGVQTRKVYCSKGSNATMTDGRCKIIPKPETERECHFPCPVDCIVSNFTDWSSCEPKCAADGVQKRKRLILQYPKNGGKPCPDALEEARHCTETQQSDCFRLRLGINSEPSYRWNITTWSECLLPVEKQPCGFGFQVRNVSCLDAYGRIVEPYFCLYDDISIVPTALRSCEVTCSSKDCVLTTWSPWSECKYTYKYKRSRHRELVGKSAYATDCEIKFNLTEEEECPVITELMLLNNNNDMQWMSCIVEEANQSDILINGEIKKHACGEGYRYKRGLQINREHGVEPGLEKDLCLVDCPLDCQLTAWTEWSPCSVPCGKGFRERRRRVLVPANSLGRPCPKNDNGEEVQKDVCHIVCADYYWLAYSWSNCSLTNDSICGNGMHYRLVHCLNKWTNEEVSESLCDPLLKPVELEPCRLHCAGECVVSPWKISKKCSEPCSRENREVMTRRVVRYPNSTADSHFRCPHLIKRSACVWNQNCFNHSFVMGSWGSCVLPEGSICGEGVQKKPLICMRSDGRQVDAVQCEKNQRSPSLIEPISKPCYVDCPADCVLSEWSEWNESSCSACGTPGYATRTRSVVQLPSDDGQPCSPILEQRKPCSFKACYHWKRFTWSPCNLETADCGYGLRHRVVECIRYDGLLVDKMNCLTVNLTFSVISWLDSSWLSLASDDSHEEEICHVPCPGDCIMTEWTPWSHCQRNCRVGQIVGYRTSSRKILFAPDNVAESSCPTQLQKTKPCWTDDCNFFRWRLHNNSLICEGKDGTIVKGGCASEPLPCEHWCQKLGGRCDSRSGICFCDTGDGFSTILEQHSHVPCKNILNGPHPPANHSAPTQVKYYPDDSQVSFWMYAMISIGTAFVIFVAITVYMMCRSSLRQRSTSVERQPSVRRRVNLVPPETNNCINTNNIVHNKDYE